MKIQRNYQPHIGCIIAFMLALLISGCGGGGGGGGGDTTSTGSSSALSIQADAGNIIGIRVGETANLDGSASSTTLGSQLSYAWSFTHKPFGSNAVLNNATLANSSFSPDVVGTYMVQLVVSANGTTSQRSIALVEASITGNVTGDVRVHTSFASKCSNCHDGRFLDATINPGVILPKSGGHGGTTNVCEACHSTFGFDLVRYVDHSEVFGSCSSCHDGVKAIGKSLTHVETTSECDVCHNTTSFLTLVNGKYDHTGITSGCASCHNGKTAIGDSGSQIHLDNPTTDCSSCHNTSNFKDAFPDHNLILTNVELGTESCTDCHGPGLTAQDVKTGHPDMSVDCVTCHGISQFSLGGAYNHRVEATVVRCDVCHTDTNSINAIGMGSFTGHLDPVGEDCGTCHGAGGTFKNAIIDHSAPSVVAARCDSCHDAGTATKKSNNHIVTQTTPTIVDCNACHVPGNFATGTFDHSVANMVGLACSGCHNNNNSVGKGTNHIATALECDSCHAADTPATPSTFTGTLFHYNPVSENFPNTGCNTCHDGVIQKGQNVTHLDTIRDCSNCHTISNTVPLSFVGATYDHGDPGISTNCASCHDGVTAINKTNNNTKTNHLPSKNECSECHSDVSVPGGFASNVFLANVHPNYNNGCAGCHTATYLSTQPTLLKSGSVNHVPTSQDCHSCHSNANFADTTQFTHAGITGNCESCHDGNYFTSANAMGKAQDPTPPHPDTTVDCGLCHGIGNNFTDGIFDHTGIVDNCSSCHADNAPAPPTGAVTRKSSFPSHVITTQDCSVCHVPGTFKTAIFNHNQINTGCVDCHLDPNATATVKPLTGHVVTSKDCYECHNKDKFAGAKYDHTGITSNCVTCHDGVIALGKDGNHVPTGKDCSVCHQTTGMKPATFDHAGITANCVSCHDGTLATGKNNGHTSTTLDCGFCHTIPPAVIVANGPTNSWIPATFDHSGVSNNTRCDSCHGVSAKGKDAKINPAHGETAADCRVCHLNTTSFLGANWVHDSSTVGNCLACHGTGGVATPQPPSGKNGHFDTTVQCDSCHTTNNWVPASKFDHCAGKNTSNVGTCTGSDYPGNHRTTLACVKCHANNSQVATYTTPLDNANPKNTLEPFCAGCHRDDFRSEGDHIGGNNGTVFQNRNCAGSGCHKVNDGGF